MADPVWGMLAKSQDDPETIEEAIARMIAEHDSDENSHLSAGGSLAQHKVSGIIDHLAGSIVADKFTQTKKLFLAGFESLDGWIKSSSGVVANYPALTIQTGGTINTVKQISAEGAGYDIMDFTKNPFFQVIFSINSLADVIARVGAGQPNPTAGGSGFGFKVEGGVCYAFILNDVTDTSTAIDNLPTGESVVLRAVADSTAETVTFFVNGVEVAVIDFPAGLSPDPVMVGAYLKNTSATNKMITLSQLIFAVD